jgi:1-acyl-sn-glycerol-3-phosphate acyltransferase
MKVADEALTKVPDEGVPMNARLSPPDGEGVAPRRRRTVRGVLLGSNVVRSIVSVWVWLVLGITAVVLLPLVAITLAVTFPFDRGRYAPGWLFRKLSVVVQVLNPLWRFRTTGTMISKPRRPYVVVANHQSFVDILLISHLPWEMKWLAKQDFFKYPVIG